jgi:hypothetical protein
MTPTPSPHPTHPGRKDQTWNNLQPGIIRDIVQLGPSPNPKLKPKGWTKANTKLTLEPPPSPPPTTHTNFSLQSKPIQAKTSQDKPRQAKTSQDKPRQDKTRQAKTSQAKPSQAKPSQDKPREAKPRQAEHLSEADLLNATPASGFFYVSEKNYTYTQRVNWSDYAKPDQLFTSEKEFIIASMLKGGLNCSARKWCLRIIKIGPSGLHALSQN